MVYEVEVQGRLFRVRLVQRGPGRLQAWIDDRPLEVDAVPGHLLVEGSSVPYRVARDRQGLVTEVVLPRGRLPTRLLGMGARLRAESASGPRAATNGAVSAPMNGQVVKILAHPGESVQAGQVVLVLEAMKMENEVTAPVAGVLHQLAVKEGEAVHPGTLLFVVAPPES
jgi:biotin carboxyl carrier protein